MMTKIHKMDLLIALYTFCIAVSELMGGKTFPLLSLGNFTLNASVAIFTIPIVFTINDVILEVHGKQRARSVVRSGLTVVVLITLFSLLAVSLPPSARFQKTEAAYDTIFGTAIRISIASLIAFALAEFTDLWVFSKIRARLGTRALWLRNNASNFAAQLLDTVIFLTLAFYDPTKVFAGNVGFLVSIITPYWLLKCFMSVIETPFVYAGVRWLKTDAGEQ